MKTSDGVEIVVGRRYFYFTPAGKAYQHLPFGVTAEVLAIFRKQVRISYFHKKQVYIRNVSPGSLKDISDWGLNDVAS